MPKRQYKIVQPEYEDQAEAWLNKAERDIRLGAWRPPQLDKAEKRRKSVLFKDYSEQWLDNRRKATGEPIRETSKQKHREALRLYLLPFFGNKTMDSITAKDVQAWWDDFTPVRSGEDNVHVESRRANVYATLRAIMNSAATESVDSDGNTLIKESPCKIKAIKGDIKHKVVIAEIDQLDALYNAFPSWLRLCVYLGGYLGLREGECLGLQRQDIDLDKKIVHVRRAAKTETYKDGSKKTVLGPTKTRGSVRDIAIPQFLEQPIIDHLKRVGEEPDSLLFPSPRTKDVCRGQTLRNAFNRAINKVPKLTGMRFHDLRDTALTRDAAMGATTGELMRKAGHQTLAVASRYQHQVESHFDSVMNNLNAAVNDARKNKEPLQEVDSLNLGIGDPLEICQMLSQLPEDKRNDVLSRLPADVLVKVVTMKLKG